MRIRQIKPSVCTNEDLADLGPYSYILFTGLWMMADRAGRFEYRPKRIKALIMPLWDACDFKMVAELVEKLVEKGMLQRYEKDGKTYMQIAHWKKHQRPDPRERKSEIPPPTNGNSSASQVPRNQPIKTQCNYTAKTVELHCQDSGILSGNWELGTGLRTLRKVSKSSSCYVQEHADDFHAEHEHKKTEPPAVAHPMSHPRKTQSATPHRIPETAHAVAAAASEAPPAADSSSRPAAARPAASQRIEVPEASGNVPIDTHWPHLSEDFALLRDSMLGLAHELHMPRPDDGIIRRVLDSGYGASAEEIRDVLVGLFKQRKFDSMRSWGLLPIVVGQQFRVA